MSTPRYTVGSVSGYGDSSHGGSGHWSTIWYVQDSAYGYQTVQEFRGRHADYRALALAAELNGTPKPESPYPPERRKSAPRVPAAERTHCVHGHEYTPWNTYTNPTTGRRSCMKCSYDSNQRRDRRRRAAA